jgi:kynurenine formamidase
MVIQLYALVLANLISLQAAQGAAFDVASVRLVDLGHAYGEETLYWPSKPPAQFKLEQLSYGETPGGWFYAANRFCTASTAARISTRRSICRDGHTVDAVPLTQLVAPAVRIDVREQRLAIEATACR